MHKIFYLKANDIKNLKLKLEGKLPIDRDELLALINTWGRSSGFYTYDKDNEEIYNSMYKPNEKYDLSKLDVSNITNFSNLFYSSYFNGDINSWDVSNGIIMSYMFAHTQNFNSPLDKWDVSNVIILRSIFAGSKSFNQNINSWNISKVEDLDYMFAYSEAFNQHILLDISKVYSCIGMFYKAKAFVDRFNNGQELPYDTKEWLKENRNKMMAFDIEYSKGKELDNFVKNFNMKNNLETNFK